MKNRIPAAEARVVADSLLETLRPGCVELKIAGSLRRGCRHVSDIELVAQPRMNLIEKKPPQRGLFDDPAETEYVLVSELEMVLAASGLIDGALKNGPKYKQLFVDGFKVDLFIVTPPAQFGCQFVLRTGPADFSKLLVTDRRQGGAMLIDLKQSEGALWFQGKVIPTPTERDYFKALKLRYIPPEQRTVHALKKEINRSIQAARKHHLATR